MRYIMKHSVMEDNHMKRKEYLLHVLDRSNNDGTMYSEYLSRLELMDKVVNAFKENKIFYKDGILRTKQEIVKRYILDSIYSDQILFGKDTALLDLNEVLKDSGIKRQGAEAVEEYLKAFLAGNKDICDLKKEADKRVEYVMSHISEKRVKNIYSWIGVFKRLRIYVIDPRIAANDKDESACFRFCRTKAREIEMELCRILWEPNNLLTLQPILHLPKIGNFLAYLTYVKRRYETPLNTDPEDLYYYYYEDSEYGWVAQYEDVAWKAVGDTREEAINNLFLTWRHAEDKADFVWLEINKEYSDRLNYRALLEEQRRKVCCDE